MAFIGNQIITLNSLLDLDGQELVLDADADSTIHVSTDDQIDFRAGGTDVMSLSTTGLTITNASNDTQLTLKSTDTDSSSGPVLDLFRDSASPADSDVIGQINFSADDDAGNQSTFFRIKAQATDVSEGSEDATVYLNSVVAGSMRERLTIKSNEIAINADSLDFDFRVASDGNANMLFVDAGNNRVGVGTSSPATALDVDGGANSDQATFSGTASRGLKISTFSVGAADEGVDFDAQASGSTQALTFSVGGAEKARLDGSGNFMMGRTSSSSATAGAQFSADGNNIVRDGQSALTVKRLSSDGDIITFAKDSTSVGTIASSSGDFKIDAPADIILDADGAEVKIADGGTNIGNLFNSSNDFTIKSLVNDADLVFKGEDGGSTVTAAFFDMSDAGTFRTGSMGSANPGAGSHGTIIINGDGGVLITGNSSGNTQALRIYSSTSGSPTATITALGALAKTSGSFKIDHPLESKKDTHYLVHSFIEGPQADLIYRGKVTLSAGTATVNVDTATGMTEGTFVALNRETQCFTTNETGWTAIKGSISGNTLTITAQDNSCTDTISWMVIGERHDPHMKDGGTDWTDSDGKVILEPEKESE